MMPSITYINSNLAISRLKDRMASASFHVVCTLIKVSDSRYMILQMFSNYVTTITNDYTRIPERLSMFHIPLENGTDDDHVILSSKLLKKQCRFSIYRLSKFTPSFLTSTECKWHRPGLLHTQDIYSCSSSSINDGHQLLKYGPLLFQERCSRRKSNRILNEANPDDPRFSQ
nr:hypothetical protein Iba_chr06aCG2150 [Ipomoea batatas]